MISLDDPLILSGPLFENINQENVLMNCLGEDAGVPKPKKSLKRIS